MQFLKYFFLFSTSTSLAASLMIVFFVPAYYTSECHDQETLDSNKGFPASIRTEMAQHAFSWSDAVWSPSLGIVGRSHGICLLAPPQEL